MLLYVLSCLLESEISDAFVFLVAEKGDAQVGMLRLCIRVISTVQIDEF